jgi:tRNA-dihydrouridine synthase
MVARGSLGNPRIFSEICGLQEPMSKKEAVILHAKILTGYMDERTACVNMRKHLLWYLKGIKGAAALKAEAARASRLSDIISIAERAF